jgi:hypothetical protein
MGTMASLIATILSKGIKMKDSRKIVYRYNGDASSDEVEVDFNGDMPVPRAGESVTRNGKQWRTIQVEIESDGVGMMKVVHLYLTDRP